jgi:N-hydroxyarylamine O-acetyltransferase
MSALPIIDLDAYFARIGYTGPRAPTLAVLRALHLQHMMAVPTENLDVLLGQPISIDLVALGRKLVQERRGGYCFEHNTLFHAVLRSLGFPVTPLLARVRWQVPADYRTPLTHMVLRVGAEGRDWLVDVGMGAVGPTAPLALDTEAEQSTPHEPRRLRQSGGMILHQLRSGTDWLDVYEFCPKTVPVPMDFELSNWYSCTHPKAYFMNNLVVTRTEPDRRVIIFNCDFTYRYPDGRAETRNIASPNELLALLAEHFNLPFPAGTRFGKPGAAWPV